MTAPGTTVTVTTPTTTVTTITETAPTETETRPEERPTIRIISFNKGFMWTDLFDENDQPLPPLQKFMEEENINVVVEFADEATVRQKVQLDFTSRTGIYDITLADSFALVPTYGGTGFLEPLNEYIEKYPTKYLNVSDILPKALEGVTMEGKIYALPHFSFAATFNYRADLFERYGVKVPKTIDEFLDALEKLKKGLQADGLYGKIYPITMRGEPRETTALDVNAFTWGMGGCWFEKLPDGSCPKDRSDIIKYGLKPTFNTTFLTGFKLYTDILREYAPPETPTYDFSAQINTYAAGKAAILFPQSVNAFVALAFGANETIRPHMKFAPTVEGREGRLIQQWWSMSFGINRDSKNKLAAWKVLTLLTGYQTQRHFALNVFPFPSLKSVLNDPEVREKWAKITGIPNIMDILIESLETAEPHYVPYIKETNIIEVKIGQEASAVIAGLKTAEEAAQDLQDFVTTLLTGAGYYSVENRLSIFSDTSVTELMAQAAELSGGQLQVQELPPLQTLANSPMEELALLAATDVRARLGES